MPASVRRLVALVCCVVMVGAGTSGCRSQGGSQDHRAAPARTATGSVASGTVQRVESPRALRTLAQRVLDRRARAVRSGNLKAFLGDVDRSDPGFVAEQTRFFANLRQLPLQKFGYRVQADRWNTSYAAERWRSTAYIPYVRQRMQLRGFDRYPVDTVFGVTFARSDRHWRIVSDTDVADRTTDGAQEAPWDLTAIRVVRSARVLGIFDAGSVGDSDTVMSAAENSIDVVSHTIPVHWRKRLVLYALSDGKALHRLGGIPGGDPDELSGIAFPVYADADRSSRVASVRVFVHPDYISSIEPSHDVLLTHEMTHVAVAGVAGGGPVWMQEGLAEWVGTGAADPSYWRYNRALIVRAAKGADEMPSTYTFNTVDQWWNYNLALMTCDYIADHFGVDTLWRTYLALQRNDYVHTDEEQNAVLEKQLGFGSHELARRAASHMVDSSAYSYLGSR